MRVIINGKVEVIKSQSSLAELILSKGLREENVVIEHNLRILPKKEWKNTHLRGDDKVEIVSFIGGG